MADKQILEQMLEHLVNEDQQKAEELFHDYVVAKSREIYESLIDSEISEEEEKDEEDEDEDVEEAASDEDAEEDQVDEEFEDIAIEGDDEADMGGDPTDDLEGEMDMGDEEGEDEMGEKEPEELFQDLDAIVDELQAKFDAMNGGDEGEGEMDDEMKDDFDLETVREYVEKVPAGHGAEKKGSAEQADNKKSTIDNMKNDMGGTTANILSSKEDAATFANQGELKGSGLLKGKPQEDNAGNINVPGGKAGGAFSTKEPGHGAEKKGAAEQADKSAGSLFRGRR
jgi:hypothetical protein